MNTLTRHYNGKNSVNPVNITPSKFILYNFARSLMMPFNTASAITSHDISLGKIELPGGERKSLAECTVKAESFTLSGTPEEVSHLFGFGVKINGGSEYSGVTRDEVAGKMTYSHSISGPKTLASFFIQSYSGSSNKVDSNLTLELGKDGCYDCTLSDGSKLTYGDCSGGNNIPPAYNAASRILAPIATILGGLLLLF